MTTTSSAPADDQFVDGGYGNYQPLATSSSSSLIKSPSSTLSVSSSSVVLSSSAVQSSISSVSPSSTAESSISSQPLSSSAAESRPSSVSLSSSVVESRLSSQPLSSSTIRSSSSESIPQSSLTANSASSSSVALSTPLTESSSSSSASTSSSAALSSTTTEVTSSSIVAPTTLITTSSSAVQSSTSTDISSSSSQAPTTMVKKPVPTPKPTRPPKSSPKRPNFGVPNIPDMRIVGFNEQKNYYRPIVDTGIIQYWDNKAISFCENIPKENIEKMNLQRRQEKDIFDWKLTTNSKFVCSGDYFYDCSRVHGMISLARTFKGYAIECDDTKGTWSPRSDIDTARAMCNSYRRLKTQNSFCVNGVLYFCEAEFVKDKLPIKEGVTCAVDMKDPLNYSVHIPQEVNRICEDRRLINRNICFNEIEYKCPRPTRAEKGVPTMEQKLGKCIPQRNSNDPARFTSQRVPSLNNPKEGDDVPQTFVPAAIVEMCKFTQTAPSAQYCSNGLVYRCKKVGRNNFARANFVIPTTDIGAHEPYNHEDCARINDRNQFFATRNRNAMKKYSLPNLANLAKLFE